MDKAFFVKIMIVVIAYFSPVHELMFAVFALWIIDFITGVCKSIKCKKRISSNRMFLSVIKLLSFELVIISSHIFSVSILDGKLNLTSVVGGFIGATELLSILENLTKITGVDFLKNIGNKILTYSNQHEKIK